MRATVRDPQALRAVKPDCLERYLLNHNWTERQHTDSAATYAQTVGEVEYEILVPLSEGLRDFPARIAEAIGTLETVEQRDQLQILSDLASSRADVLRIRRPGAEDGTIQLEDGVSLVTSACDMILAAACTTVAPRLYYPGRKPPAATDYLSQTRLGQSERGSYVLTVISPVPPRTNNDLFPGLNDPFERKVTRTLSTALNATIQASEAALRTADQTPFRDAMNDGVSANLIDAVVGLMGPNHRPVDVGFSWATEYPLNFEPRNAELDPEYAPILRDASRYLKQVAEQPIEIAGAVIGLRRPAGAETGRATLVTFLDGKPKSVGVELDAGYYDVAIQAHQQHRMVICEGVLVRAGRTTALTRMTRFELLPESEDDEA